MKQLLRIIFFALLLPATALAQQKYEEGTHYEIINDKASAKPVVEELFSFWCPACYAFEPIAQQLDAKLKEKGIKFEKIHVNFMGHASTETQEALTKAMYIGKALKKDKQLNAAVFNYLHKQRSKIASEQDIKNIFLVNGVENDQYDKMAKSFAVNGMFNKNQKALASYSNKVKSVPAFVVNGKYRAQMVRGMNPDDFIDLVIWLTEQK